MKICRKCKQEKPLEDFWKNKNHKDGLQLYCKICHYGEVKKNLTGPDRQKYLDLRRNRHLKNKYNITIEEYNKMLESQNGVCAICGVSKTGRNMPVDHNHSTGEIRAILCENCNRGLGMFMDNSTNLRLAADYIDSFQ